METQRGFTLVEILAALVIFGIVLISIMTIFPQMTLFNEHTDTKINTMNLAREEIRNIETAKFNANDFTTEILMKEAIANVTGLDSSDVSIVENVGNGKMAFEYSKNPYDYILTVDRAPQIAGKTSLYRLSLTLQSDNKLSSKTYGYITLQ